MKKTKGNPHVTARQRVFSRLAFHRNRLLVNCQKSHDDRLASVTLGLGVIGGSINGNPLAPELVQTLDRIAAHCIGWAENLLGKDVFLHVHNERERQEQLLKAGKFLFTCSSPVVDPQRKLRVLVEEIGEVAEAIEKVEMEKLDAKNFLISELIQSAAVCVAWLESLEPATSNVQPATRK